MCHNNIVHNTVKILSNLYKLTVQILSENAGFSRKKKEKKKKKKLSFCSNER